MYTEEINAIIQQGHIILIKTGSKYIYSVIKYL